MNIFWQISDEDQQGTAPFLHRQPDNPGGFDSLLHHRAARSAVSKPFSAVEASSRVQTTPNQALAKEMGKRKRQSKTAGPSSASQKRSQQSPNRLPSDSLTTDNHGPDVLTVNHIVEDESRNPIGHEPDTNAGIRPDHNEHESVEEETNNLGGEQENDENENVENEDNENENQENEIRESENDELEDDSETLAKSTTSKKVIDLNEIKKFGQKVDRTGLVYVSRIPPGMGPSKLKHLLSKWGAIGRIYLARDEKAEESKRKFNKKGKMRKNLKDKHQSFLFKEGWVEFIDKKVARRVAEMLNTRPIGGKPSDRYYSDLWTLTYLPKFKWTNLSDQIAIERRIKEQLVRNSLEESKISQDWYLGMVEKNSTNQKILAKQLKKKPDSAATAKAGKPLDFRQRELPSAQNEHGSKLKSVLDGLF
ncbi:RNA-binding ATPase activator esf2 [Puccinia graminis f. sp. tritici]|uniref:18S rRNA factor 2 n=2 Tax=Puccinia graminis f. sp. tritici TaxID=56615 RepID=E3JV54_PUCGT|nr:uncharacterized protein PGTG_01260 [Puccinia graminis f. sp. tritici CRL 75-36-700-3]EFP75929.2 hypothetical protein PGTG_01260 [Puccinia graminis f. sp. tritici CRL 75-36-700-3]KAA1085256.1 RNA-binding ATPase activator esf2 [Puccinia graminis f. sp. tritici]